MPNIDAIMRLVEDGYSLEEADRRVALAETEQAKWQHENWLAEQEAKATNPYAKFEYIVDGKTVGREEYLKSIEETKETFARIRANLGWFEEELAPAYAEMYKETHKPVDLGEVFGDIFGFESVAKMGIIGGLLLGGLVVILLIVMRVA